MVEESDRIWSNLDNHAKSIGDHCIRITALELEHKAEDKRKKTTMTYILGAVVIMQFSYLIIQGLI